VQDQRRVTVAADVVAHLAGAVVAVDLEGRIRHWSSGAERSYGWSTAEAVGQRIRELILLGEHERADAVKARTRAGSEWVGEFSAVHEDGRRLVVWAEGLGLDLHDAALLVTEVATDALRHGGPGVDLWLRPVEDGGLRVEIVDGRAESLPRLRIPDDDDEGGGGLLGERAGPSWASERLPAGTCVWFEVAPPLAGLGPDH
jgi:PAS domain S-box-containing protein